MALCANNALYTGITTDLERRMREHNSGKGASYTRSFGPVKPVWSEPCRTKADALKLEALIKRLGRAAKLRLCGGNGKWRH